MTKNDLTFRPLTAEDVEVRAAQVKQNGVILLIYKDARVDQDILDETVGKFNWKKKYEVINGNLYCTISIKDSITGEWVDKMDVGVESNTEKEKGEASDAQKRAGFVWGIGRELYTAPFIWVPSDRCEIEQNASRGFICKTNFRVADMKIENNRIADLKIANGRTGEIVYSMNAVKTSAKPAPAKSPEGIPLNSGFMFLEHVIKMDGRPDMTIGQMLEKPTTLKAAEAVKLFFEKISKEETRSDEDRNALKLVLKHLESGAVKFVNVK